MIALADLLRRSYCESRGVSPLSWDLLKLSEQDQWLETAHIFVRMGAACGISCTFNNGLSGAMC